MSLRTTFITTTTLALSTLATSQALAYDLGEYGKIIGDVRLRHEYVDQESFANDAHANTVRTRLGYMTPTWEGLTGYVEGEAIQYIGAERFNDGANGNTAYPRVNDPEDVALNQLYLNYLHAGTGTGVTLGRQYITYDNQRWVGWSKFRQNDRTHDAARISLKPLDGLNLDYAHSVAVHRAEGSRQVAGEQEGAIDLIHADYALPNDLKAIGYGYFLDFESRIATSSSQTIGGRMEWRPKDTAFWGITPLATVDMAQQQDYGSNPTSYSEWYNLFEIGGTVDGYSLVAAYERLGGDGAASVKTPIATVHSLNGWVDKFTTTPNNGLQDYYLVFKAPIGLPWEGHKLGFETQLHHFSSDANDLDYGREIDIGFSYTPVENHTITAQAGRYFADDFSDDTTKVWLYYDMKF